MKIRPRSSETATVDNKNDIKIDDTEKNKAMFLFIVAFVCFFVA